MTFKNVHSFPKSCAIKIPNVLYYNPTIFATYNLNRELENLNYQNKVKLFKLNTLNIKSLPKMEKPLNNFLIVYTEKVMPWITLLFIPIIIIVAFIVGVVVKKLILNKIKVIREILDGMKTEDD